MALSHGLVLVQPNDAAANEAQFDDMLLDVVMYSM